jgi:hypothetical protein
MDEDGGNECAKSDFREPVERLFRGVVSLFYLRMLTKQTEISD